MVSIQFSLGLTQYKPLPLSILVLVKCYSHLISTVFLQIIGLASSGIDNWGHVSISILFLLIHLNILFGRRSIFLELFLLNDTASWI